MDTTADAYLYAGVRMMSDANLWSPLIAAASGLAGVWFGGSLTLRRDREDRRLQFLRVQLEEFYAPLYGIRLEIKAKSEFRERIRAAARSPESDRAFEEFKKVIEYDNRALVEDLIPGYQRMIELFKEKIGLAEESTVTCYPPLLEFVETWTRSTEGGFPSAAHETIGHSEERVYPLYEDVERQVARLREELRGGGGR